MGAGLSRWLALVYNAKRPKHAPNNRRRHIIANGFVMSEVLASWNSVYVHTQVSGRSQEACRRTHPGARVHHSTQPAKGPRRSSHC